MKEAVARLNNEPIPQRKTIKIDFDFIVAGKSNSELLSAAIPENFIKENELRLECYQRLSSMSELRHIDDYNDELRDRFGKLPKSVVNLLKLEKIKILGNHHHISEILVRDRKVMIKSSNGLVRDNGNLFPRLKSRNKSKFLDEILKVIGKLKYIN